MFPKAQILFNWYILAHVKLREIRFKDILKHLLHIMETFANPISMLLQHNV